jgi:hypothetical protein
MSVPRPHGADADPTVETPAELAVDRDKIDLGPTETTPDDGKDPEE